MGVRVWAWVWVWVGCVGHALAMPVSEDGLGGGGGEDRAWSGRDFVLAGLGVASLLTTVTSLLACICCKRSRGFKELGSVSSRVAGSTSTLTPGPREEITLFPPAGLSVSSTQINFEPLPDIRPRPSALGHHPRPPADRTLPPFFPARPPAHAASSPTAAAATPADEWFAEPHQNFPRNQLQYVRELGRGWFGQVLEGQAAGVYSDHTKGESPVGTAQGWDSTNGSTGRKVSSSTSLTPVAVKVLREDATPQEQHYFLQELRPFRHLSHPNVLKVLAYCLEAEPFLILLQLCPKGDLKAVLRGDGSLSEVSLLRMTLDVAAGLTHMHTHSFIHTDLAARNCVVEADNTIKIGDYGFSLDSYKEEYYCAGEVALPLRWCSPETLRCTDTTIETKEVTQAANVWSFGVVMWEVASRGQLPYIHLDNEQVIQEVIVDQTCKLDLPPNQQLHAEKLHDIMRQCWEGAASRPSMAHIHSLLAHLWQHTTASASTPQQDTASLGDFEQRWNQLQQQDSRDHSILHTSGNMTNLRFESDFNLSSAMSPSLQNLHGSAEDLDARVAAKFKSAFPSWLGVEPGQPIDSLTQEITDAILKLDDYLAGEKSEPSTADASPEKANGGVNFRVGKDSFVSNPPESIAARMGALGEGGHCSISGTLSEEEEEGFTMRLEQGEFTEMVRLKSQSVQDFMRLTVVDDTSDSDSASQRNSIGFEPLTQDKTYSSEGNIKEALRDVKFMGELERLQAEHRYSIITEASRECASSIEYRNQSLGEGIREEEEEKEEEEKYRNKRHSEGLEEERKLREREHSNHSLRELQQKNRHKEEEEEEEKYMNQRGQKKRKEEEEDSHTHSQTGSTDKLLPDCDSELSEREPFLGEVISSEDAEETITKTSDSETRQTDPKPLPASPDCVVSSREPKPATLPDIVAHNRDSSLAQSTPSPPPSPSSLTHIQASHSQPKEFRFIFSEESTGSLEKGFTDASTEATSIVFSDNINEEKTDEGSVYGSQKGAKRVPGIQGASSVSPAAEEWVKDSDFSATATQRHASPPVIFSIHQKRATDRLTSTPCKAEDPTTTEEGREGSESRFYDELSREFGDKGSESRLYFEGMSKGEFGDTASELSLGSRSDRDGKQRLVFGTSFDEGERRGTSDQEVYETGSHNVFSTRYEGGNTPTSKEKHEGDLPVIEAKQRLVFGTSYEGEKSLIDKDEIEENLRDKETNLETKQRMIFGTSYKEDRPTNKAEEHKEEEEEEEKDEDASPGIRLVGGDGNLPSYTPEQIVTGEDIVIGPSEDYSLDLYRAVKSTEGPPGSPGIDVLPSDPHRKSSSEMGAIEFDLDQWDKFLGKTLSRENSHSDPGFMEGLMGEEEGLGGGVVNQALAVDFNVLENHIDGRGNSSSSDLSSFVSPVFYSMKEELKSSPAFEDLGNGKSVSVPSFKEDRDMGFDPIRKPSGVLNHVSLGSAHSTEDSYNTAASKFPSPADGNTDAASTFNNSNNNNTGGGFNPFTTSSEGDSYTTTADGNTDTTPTHNNSNKNNNNISGGFNPFTTTSTEESNTTTSDRNSSKPTLNNNYNNSHPSTSPRVVRSEGVMEESFSLSPDTTWGEIDTSGLPTYRKEASIDTSFDKPLSASLGDLLGETLSGETGQRSNITDPAAYDTLDSAITRKEGPIDTSFDKPPASLVELLEEALSEGTGQRSGGIADLSTTDLSPQDTVDSAIYSASSLSSSYIENLKGEKCPDNLMTDSQESDAPTKPGQAVDDLSNQDFTTTKPGQAVDDLSNLDFITTKPGQAIDESSNRNLTATKPDQAINLDSTTTKPDQAIDETSTQNLSTTKPDQTINLDSTTSKPDQPQDETTNHNLTQTSPKNNLNFHIPSALEFTPDTSNSNLLIQSDDDLSPSAYHSSWTSDGAPGTDETENGAFWEQQMAAWQAAAFQTRQLLQEAAGRGGEDEESGDIMAAGLEGEGEEEEVSPRSMTSSSPPKSLSSSGDLLQIDGEGSYVSYNTTDEEEVLGYRPEDISALRAELSLKLDAGLAEEEEQEPEEPEDSLESRESVVINYRGILASTLSPIKEESFLEEDESFSRRGSRAGVSTGEGEPGNDCSIEFEEPESDKALGDTFTIPNTSAMDLPVPDATPGTQDSREVPVESTHDSLILEDLDEEDGPASIQIYNEGFGHEAEDILVVNTETNEATILDQGLPRSHLAFVLEQETPSETSPLHPYGFEDTDDVAYESIPSEDCRSLHKLHKPSSGIPHETKTSDITSSSAEFITNTDTEIESPAGIQVPAYHSYFTSALSSISHPSASLEEPVMFEQVEQISLPYDVNYPPPTPLEEEEDEEELHSLEDVQEQEKGDNSNGQNISEIEDDEDTTPIKLSFLGRLYSDDSEEKEDSQRTHRGEREAKLLSDSEGEESPKKKGRKVAMKSKGPATTLTRMTSAEFLASEKYQTDDTEEVEEQITAEPDSEDNSEEDKSPAASPQKGGGESPASQEPRYTPDWESDSDSDGDSSSTSGEFMWRPGEPCQPSPYILDIIEEEPDEDGEREDGEFSEDSESGEEEFTPSQWNSNLTPSHSLLKSPQNKSSLKKRVRWKRQRHHRVYEYPPEPRSWEQHAFTEPQYRRSWGRSSVDYLNLADWDLGADEFIADDGEDMEDYVYHKPSRPAPPPPIYSLGPMTYDEATEGFLVDNGEFFIRSSGSPFTFTRSSFSAADFFPTSSHSSDYDMLFTNTTQTPGVPYPPPKAPEQPEDTQGDLLYPSEPDRHPEEDIQAGSAAQEDGEAGGSGVSLGELRHTRDKLRLEIPSMSVAGESSGGGDGVENGGDGDGGVDFGKQSYVLMNHAGRVEPEVSEV
ncbi:uncharacterized protein LOC127001361 isoform X2 [Eriocheir sinensis]|uniref:uncharacterized protein LOC127001361 isoform X2 n=1 Tax=Eriocheir sinensis TaxID=95602 RepID=UPI0021C86B71|nr:uncharacterized protein LOC127001361 isoform X2 [Eriocheir sinensis]